MWGRLSTIRCRQRAWYHNGLQLSYEPKTDQYSNQHFPWIPYRSPVPFRTHAHSGRVNFSHSWSPFRRSTQLAHRSWENERPYCYHESSWSDDIWTNTSEMNDRFELGSESLSHHDYRWYDRSWRYPHHQCRIYRKRIRRYRRKNKLSLRDYRKSWLISF